MGDPNTPDGGANRDVAQGRNNTPQRGRLLARMRTPRPGRVIPEQVAAMQPEAQRQRLAALKGRFLLTMTERPAMARVLREKFMAAGKAIEAGNGLLAHDTISELEQLMLQGAPKTGPVSGVPLQAEAQVDMSKAPKTAQNTTAPLTAQATTLPLIEPEQQQMLVDIKLDLERKLLGFDQAAQRDGLYATTTFMSGDLKILRNLAQQQLNKVPIQLPSLNEAESLLKELQLKADFMRRRTQDVQLRRQQLAQGADALAIQPGAADQLLNDKTLKAGGHFTDFAKALRDYEGERSDKRRAELVKRIDSYLRHFDKFSDGDKAKDENQRKRDAVVKAQKQLAGEEVLTAQKQLAAKGDWSRDDEAKATEQYLKMMLLLGKKPPVNLKGEKATELVLAVEGLGQARELVVKPQNSEIPVPGFRPGGGASREMLASAIGDKLQEMLGIELNVAPTKVVEVDGGLLGLEAGKPVVASAQAFVARSQELSAKFADPKDMAVIPLAEIQNKAVFDLISLHCDRHAKNFMIGDDNKLVPIDHGNVLPNRKGLIERSINMCPPAAVLATAPQAAEMLSPELIERIERLNTTELADSMADARAKMPAGADVGGGDLDEGIQNSRRSTEFLKYACRQLTLQQIFTAYGRSTEDIFFTAERDKFDGFERAIKFAKTFFEAIDELTVMVNGEMFNNRPYFTALGPQFRALGWFVDTDSEIQSWVEGHPHQALKILKQRIRRPADATPKGSATAAPKFFKDENLNSADGKKLWARYVDVGGDAAWLRAGGDDSASLAARVDRMELERYEALGGDLAWMKLGADKLREYTLAERNFRLEAMSGVDGLVVM